MLSGTTHIFVALIKAYLQLEGVSPDAIVVSLDFKFAMAQTPVLKAKNPYSACKKGEFYEPNVVDGNSLLDMDVKCGWIVEAT